jgi:hypothetical protein
LESDAVVNWAVTPNDSYSAFLTALQSNTSSSLGDAVPCATASMPPTTTAAKGTTDTSDKFETAAKGERTDTTTTSRWMLLCLLVRPEHPACLCW